MYIKNKIQIILHQFHNEICSDISNTFCDRKKHVISLPYKSDFDGKIISTKARPAQIEKDYLKVHLLGVAQLFMLIN